MTPEMDSGLLHYCFCTRCPSSECFPDAVCHASRSEWQSEIAGSSSQVNNALKGYLICLAATVQSARLRKVGQNFAWFSQDV